jgi:para-aminobenzoate synthetase/4-amino-4-deoxychorismate lyase
VYQANYTFALNAHTNSPAGAIYNRLIAQSACGYGALIQTDELSLLSLSPELFFTIQYSAETGERTITTRPMKGTRTRGRFASEDAALRDELRASEKDSAENVMIVDLLRNDLGRVAEFGSVQVEALFEIEPYPTVWQMTSTISAKLRPQVGLTDIFRALFPCGSVTGAPKIASMHLLNTLEQEPRGAYCGAIGVLKPGGEAVFNVAIRTMTIDTQGNACYRVGGGITYDSGAEAEYQEALAKAAVVADLAPDFELFETFRIENGHVARLEAHLDRLASSAAALGFTYLPQSAYLTIQAVATLHSEGCKRARLRLNRAGEAIVEASALVEHPANPAFRLAKHPVNSADRFLFHKTTRRAVYEAAAAEYPDCWEVLLWNQEGELTEFTRGNLVLEHNGEMRTPALHCGLLPGVLRAELLANGTITEAVLTVADLAKASRIWFINSLRGWIEIRAEGILPA